MAETTTHRTGPGKSSDIWSDQRATMRAWERFLIGQTPTAASASGVRREIFESWSRSAASGIDARAFSAPLSNSEDEVHKLRLDNLDLRNAARGAFAKIGHLLEDAEAMLILTDAQGVIIDTIGDRKTLDAGQEIHLQIGGVWDEAVIGTNAIGTSLRAGRPVVVHASEHFCAGIKSWTCAAAPVQDPFDLRVIGAVDLSGPPGIFRPHNLALAAAVAREIEVALADRQAVERARLFEAFLDGGPTHESSDGVVILDRIGRVIYNRNSPVPDGGPDRRADLHLGRKLIALSVQMSDGDIAAALPDHLRPSGVRRLMLDGEFRGAALVVPVRRRPPAPQKAPVQIAARAGTVEEPILMIGDCPAFRDAIDLARRAAAAGSSVLIEGETGAGKELFARLVHAEARRRVNAPFVTVNCGAISSELFGSELFGHVAGAFTGAARDGKPGKFELADGGVLCLDEIGEMPLELQPYLLRVLEQRAIYRIGDSKRRPVDVQLVAMTNRDLGKEVEAGRFRRDLYYRIGMITVQVPPLRERLTDIPALAEHFNRRVGQRLKREPLILPDAVMDRLMAHRWPGNVRELRNLFERLHLLAQGTRVRIEDLPGVMLALAEPAAPPAPQAPEGTGPYPAPISVAPTEPVSLTEVECLAIRRALEAEQGNVTRVAAALGISRPTLYRKMRLYGIRRFYG